MTPTLQNVAKNVDNILRRTGKRTVTVKKSAFSYLHSTECLISIFIELN